MDLLESQAAQEKVVMHMLILRRKTRNNASEWFPNDRRLRDQEEMNSIIITEWYHHQNQSQKIHSAKMKSPTGNTKISKRWQDSLAAQEQEAT